MPDAAFAAAVLPLFADGLVDSVEWSFDMGWGRRGTPDWLDALLDDYAEAGALDGHGVSFSLLSDHPRQAAWLARLADELARRPYRRVSEHLGFMSAGDVLRSSPLPMPRHPDVIRHAQDQASRVAEVVGQPLGLENLATALASDDATQQGELCGDILAATDGWLVLDLHNLWCQAVNFQLDPVLLLETYPLSRVREVHVSGGSWWTSPRTGRRLRRDTHDGPVPQEVLALLPLALTSCARLDSVVVERIGGSFGDTSDDEDFRETYRQIRTLCGRPT